MEDFKTRLVEEAQQLTEKFEKLHEFIESDKFKTLDLINQNLLKIQYASMATYIECLMTRITILM